MRTIGNAHRMRPTDESDDVLVARTARGDQAAFAVLVRRHEGRVQAVARRFAPTAADAEEIAQGVFMRVWQAAEGWKGESRVTTWIYRITVNACIDWKRRRRFAWLPLPEAFEVPDPGPDAERGLTGRRSLEVVARAVAGLSARQRLALALSVEEELSNRDIAEVMEVSEGAVEQYLVRARRRLRDAVRRSDGEPA